MGVQNPNNWHWVDKNCIKWAGEYFNSKLVGLEATEADTSVKVTELRSMEGDAEVCQRKGRVISLFDLKLILAFESQATKGTISIPEVAFDTEPDDYQFNLSFDKEDDKTRGLLRKELIPQIRTALVDFGPTLIQANGSDIQIDQSRVNSKFTKANQELSYIKPKVVERTAINKPQVIKKDDRSVNKGADDYAPKYNTTKLDFSSKFHASAEQLYDTLLQPERVALWTRSEPDIKPVEGSEFHLFGGNIEGRLLKLVPNKQIVMLWRLRDWKRGHYTKITIDLDQGDSETKMSFSLNGVPIGEEELVQENFEEKYIKTIKMVFGFGAVL
ncbi:DEKNAAC104143 [Brettanomyces naardenensis]|uniref:DEKNAAC104143 n=1 Tax=Brettanomyces naardenensis TaxID=13370 RepID=A0A448YPZ0_BRENA|nr:DEKNAAC104143 [Brettanomyces naardenensis]